MNDLDFAGRILLAAILGALIGFERQWRQSSAGIRANALVALGAALFVSVSTLVTLEDSSTRVAAQVVTGMGFLGAGVIFRHGFTVTGLNTASTLWCSGGIGVLSGLGFERQSLIGAAAVVLANVSLRPISNYLETRKLGGPEDERNYRMFAKADAASASAVRSAISASVSETGPLLLTGLDTAFDPDGAARIEATFKASRRADDLVEQVVGAVAPHVLSVRWEIVTESPH